MNNIGKSIDSMNFEELRSFVKVLANSVQELSDLYAKTKREYNDMLYNLSRDNLSIEYIAEQESMFEQTENGLKSVIAKNIASLRKLTDEEKENATPINSFEEMTDKSLIYKMPLTDNPNKFTYFCYYAPLDMWVPINEVDQQKYSTIEQTAEKIATSVSETKKYVDDMLGDVELDGYTTIEQTADAITQTAYRGINLSEAIEISGDEFLPDEYDGNEYFISHNGYGVPGERTYYAYNYALKKYMPIIDGQSIYTVFKQTADGFVFQGNVRIDASLIVQGEMKGINIYVGDSMTDQPIAIIADDIYDAYIKVGTVGVIRPSVSPAQMIISSKTQGADMLIESKTLRFNCSQVEGLGVVPVFGG